MIPATLQKFVSDVCVCMFYVCDLTWERVDIFVIIFFYYVCVCVFMLYAFNFDKMYFF